MIYMSLFFGIGMPILFVFTSVALFLIWAFERLAMAKMYKRPPEIDTQLTIYVIRMLKVAPLLMVMNSFWLLTNR